MDTVAELKEAVESQQKMLVVKLVEKLDGPYLPHPSLQSKPVFFCAVYIRDLQLY